ncbi:MAG: YafY family protein [Pseudomonas sp.]|uniref:helix-turn-helix transcriptional regulator n=1 Tax=Pseudomonas sp. TaxID=306 RepID=UPI003395718F
MANPTGRVLALLELLQSGGQQSGRALAERLGVDGRTLRRYLRTLEDLGIPLTSERGRHGGYRLVAGFKLPPMMFTPAEAQALTLGLLAAGELGLAQLAPAVHSARAKLERVMPAPLKQQVRALSESTALVLPRSRALGDQQVLATLASASQARERVRLSYRSGQDALSEREVDPYGLVYRDGLWYLSGRCHLRNALRSFRLDRVQTAVPLLVRFTRPADFDAAAHLQSSLANLPRAHAVQVLLHTDLASAAREWGEQMGVLIPQARGVLLSTGTDHLQWFALRLARLPFDFEVEAPPQLRTALQGLGQRLIASTR